MANIKDSVVSLIDLLRAVKKINDTLQDKHAAGSTEWHQHESIDDKLHEALGLLGE